MRNLLQLLQYFPTPTKHATCEPRLTDWTSLCTCLMMKMGIVHVAKNWYVKRATWSIANTISLTQSVPMGPRLS